MVRLAQGIRMLRGKQGRWRRVAQVLCQQNKRQLAENGPGGSRQQGGEHSSPVVAWNASRNWLAETNPKQQNIQAAKKPNKSWAVCSGLGQSTHGGQSGAAAAPGPGAAEAGASAGAAMPAGRVSGTLNPGAEEGTGASSDSSVSGASSALLFSLAACSSACGSALCCESVRVRSYIMWRYAKSTGMRCNTPCLPLNKFFASMQGERGCPQQRGQRCLHNPTKHNGHWSASTSVNMQPVCIRRGRVTSLHKRGSWGGRARAPGGRARRRCAAAAPPAAPGCPSAWPPRPRACPRGSSSARAAAVSKEPRPPGRNSSASLAHTHEQR